MLTGHNHQRVFGIRLVGSYVRIGRDSDRISVLEEADGEYRLEAENYDIPLSELLRRILDEHIDGKNE